jgi:hypothetical protein
MISYLLLLLLGMALGMIVFYLIIRRYENGPAGRDPGLSGYSEVEAEKILQNKGYKVTARQNKAAVITYIDGKSHLGFVAADFIVEKNDKRYAVKVKSGESGDPTDPGVRRELLEYEYAHRPDGILMLNLPSGEVHDISFELPRAESESFFKIMLIAFIIFIIVAIIGMLFLLKLI